MPQWSRDVTTDPKDLPYLLNKAIERLVQLVDDQLGNTANSADALIKASTPIQTMNLKNSWHTDKVNAAKIGAEVRSYLTYNDAKSYDPNGNGEQYALFVELGLPSSTRPPRPAGPANMIGGNINNILNTLKINIENIA